MRKLVTLPTIIVVGLTLALTGCAGSNPNEGPITNADGNYETDYVEVDGNAIACMWYKKDYQTSSISCDWNNPVQTGDLGELVINEGEDGYEVEYVKLNERVYRCLWYKKDYKTASHDCDWDNALSGEEISYLKEDYEKAQED